MYDDFISRGNEVSYQLYRRLFDSQNIAFGIPSSDECNQCLSYQKHEKDIDSSQHDSTNCELCCQFQAHITKATNARKKYRKDIKLPNVFCVDMQQVIIIPKLTTKEAFFTSRLVCFNETFASGKSGEKDYAVVWHEGIKGRKAGDVASSYVKFLGEVGEKFPIFWTDNCAGQNKNWLLFTAMVSVVNSPWGPEDVTIKYLESGHTFMAADSIHGVIGKKMRACPEIISFKDLTNLVENSSKKTTVVNMNVNDFYDFKAGQRARNSRKVQIPKLCDIVEVKFVKESRLMYFKCTHDTNEYEGVDFLKPRYPLTPFPEQIRVPRGITSKKKQGILRILGHVDALKRKFYDELFVNDQVEDLVSEFDQ